MRFATRLWIIIFSLAHTASASAQVDQFWGEPVALKSNFIYFTSWKYVRQGAFSWKIQIAPSASEAEKNIGAWLAGDGNVPAQFVTDGMPRGIRLETRPATKIPFLPGQLAATLYDDGKYKAWYTQGPCPAPEPFSSKDKILPGYNSHLCYAESDDGATWTAPALGLFEYAGNTDNNLVFRGDLNGSIRGMHTACVFIDPSSQEERYKLFYVGILSDAEWAAFATAYPDEVDTMARRQDVGGYRCVLGVFGAVSPDGIHWQSLTEPLMVQHADTHNTCYYDEERREYVAYMRAWQVNPKEETLKDVSPDNWIGVGRRSIGRAVSKDFRHFGKPEIVCSTGADMAPTHLYYTNGKTSLPNMPDNHIMLPWVWELERDGGDVWLLSSADGWSWSRVPGDPAVSTGRPGTADGAMVVCTGNLLEYPGDRWAIAYSGTPIPHKYPGRDIEKRQGLFPGVSGVNGLAVWPKGRLVALVCDEEGEFATVAVMPKGNRIRINASVQPTGYIHAAVRWFNGDELPGKGFEQADPVIGDGLAMPVSWHREHDLNHDGKPIILSFRLRQAELYGIEFY